MFIHCTRENSDASRLVVWWIRVRTLANPPDPRGGPVGGEVQSMATPLVLEIKTEGFPGGGWKRGSTRVWKKGLQGGTVMGPTPLFLGHFLTHYYYFYHFWGFGGFEGPGLED